MKSEGPRPHLPQAPTPSPPRSVVRKGETEQYNPREIFHDFQEYAESSDTAGEQNESKQSFDTTYQLHPEKRTAAAWRGPRQLGGTDVHLSCPCILGHVSGGLHMQEVFVVCTRTGLP